MAIYETYLLNTETFTNNIKGQRISNGYQMVSLEVKSLFTNVPLNGTIDIILRNIYDENKIVTNKINIKIIVVSLH